MAQSCDRIVHGLRQAGVRIDLVHFVAAHDAAASGRAPTGEIETRRERLNGRDMRWALDHDLGHGMSRLFAWLEGSSRTRPYTHVVAFGGRHPLAAAPVFAAWLGARLITLLRGNDFESGIFSARRRHALMEALSASHRIGAVTSDMARKVKALLPGTNVVHTPNGIDLADWLLLPSHLAAARHWRNESALNERLVLGCFGRLKKKKGVDFLLECLRQSGCANQTHLHLVGTLEPDAEARLAAPGGPWSVSRRDFIPRSQLPGEYAKCDYVVIPSFYDGMPNVLLEAGGLGLPLIASDVGGMRDLIGASNRGWLFQAGDAEGCRAAIRRACATPPDRRASMGAALRLHIAEHFTAQQETARYLDLLQPSTQP
jgi:glycosyltransferase involved in cell wall biosynthesis